MKPKYNRPILARLFDIFAVLAFIGAVVSLVGAFLLDPAFRMAGISGAVGLIFTGIVYLGIGQVIDSLGRSAYYAEISADHAAAQLAETTKQTQVLERLLAEADETAGDRYAASEETRKFHEKALTFLARADAQNEHTNAMLKWIGESKAAGN